MKQSPGPDVLYTEMIKFTLGFHHVRSNGMTKFGVNPLCSCEKIEYLSTYVSILMKFLLKITELVIWSCENDNNANSVKFFPV